MFAACLALVMGIVLSSTGNRAHADQSNTSSSTTETGHKKWSRMTLDTADRIDRFFSNQSIVDEGQETRLRVYVKIRVDEHDGQNLAAGIRGKLSLPRTEQRLQIIFGQDDDSTNPVNTEGQNISLRIRPAGTDSIRQMRFDAGIRKRSQSLVRVAMFKQVTVLVCPLLRRTVPSPLEMWSWSPPSLVFLVSSQSSTAIMGKR